MADDLAANFAIPQSKLVVLRNPISTQDIRYRSGYPRSHPLSGPSLLAVGRLSLEKGFDLLLNALARVSRQYPTLTLTLVGIGPQAGALRQLTRLLNLESHVTFAGHQSDLGHHYQAASLFILPSRNEGMPNALLEAAAAGLPIVATPCCQGVVDLLQSAPGTWLSSSTSGAALSAAILTALASLNPTHTERFDHNFIAPFETSTAIHAYETLLVDRATGPSS